MKIRYRFCFIFLAVLMPNGLFSQTITDVPRTDPSYSAISSAIKSGYLSLFSDNTFQGSGPITRREMAIFLEKLSNDTGTGLTKVQMQELQQLAKSYKTAFVNLDSKVASQNVGLTTVMQNTAAVYQDLWQVNDGLQKEMKALKEENERNQLYMWIGIGAALVLGFIN